MIISRIYVRIYVQQIVGIGATLRIRWDDVEATSWGGLGYGDVLPPIADQAGLEDAYASTIRYQCSCDHPATLGYMELDIDPSTIDPVSLGKLYIRITSAFEGSKSSGGAAWANQEDADPDKRPRLFIETRKLWPFWKFKR